MPAPLVSLPLNDDFSTPFTSLTRTPRHTSPQCKAIAKPGCVAKGHMVECPVHGATNAAYGVCHQCKEEVRRAENESAKANEREREAELKRKKAEEEEAKIRAKNDRKSEKYEGRWKRKSDGSASGSASA